MIKFFANFIIEFVSHADGGSLIFVLKCIYFWPEDGRPYVALGKILSKQSKTGEARLVYEKGCQATQGENPYIWQVCNLIPNNLASSVGYSTS